MKEVISNSFIKINKSDILKTLDLKEKIFLI